METGPEFKKHVFICERCSYQETDGMPCAEGTAKKFRKSVKKLASVSWPKSEVRINGSGCLGQCDKGISCIIYPKGDWLLKLRPGDEGKVLTKLSEDN